MSVFSTFSRFDTFSRNEKGHVGVIFALAALPLLVFCSVAVEYTQLTKERNAVSQALDAAVLAAANNNAIPNAEKHEYAQAYFLSNYSGNIDLQLTPSISAEKVRLVAEGKLSLTFSNFLGGQNLDLVEASAATLRKENTICVLSLSEEADEAISFDNNLVFIASNCGIHANSTSPSAISALTRSFKPVASSFCAVGGVSGEVEPHSKGECTSVADPYKDVPAAKIGSCKSHVQLDSFVRQAQTNVPTNVFGDEEELTYNIIDLDAAPITLPDVNPVSVEELLVQLPEHNFANGQYNGSNERNSPAFLRDVQRLQSLTGDELQSLVNFYDKTGSPILRCRDFPIVAFCSRDNNPYRGEPTVKDLAKAVFNLSFGDFVNQGPDIPDIVKQGVVELINGRLYSRNNIDNQLVPVSANLTGGNITLTPGTYCGGLTVDGINVSFTPGDYIFKDGPLTFLNKSKAKADKVTFGFSGTGATLNIESGSSLTIRSATTGPRKGLAFMQIVDHSLPGNRKRSAAVNRIASGGSVSMSGTAYFPQQRLMISGEDTHLGANSPAVGLIADTVTFRGEKGSRVEIGVDHVKAGIPPIQPQSDDGVRLIE